MIRLINILCFYVLLFFAVGGYNCAQAHQMKEAITVVTFNQNSGYVEVAHRVYVHDAEVVVKALFGNDNKLLENPKSQTDFGEYIASHFSMQFDSKPLKLKLLGQEVKGQHMWVYQEHPFSIKPKQITIKYNAMMDHWPDQRNVINIEGLGAMKTIQLFNNDDSRVIEME